MHISCRGLCSPRGASCLRLSLALWTGTLAESQVLCGALPCALPHCLHSPRGTTGLVYGMGGWPAAEPERDKPFHNAPS